MSDFLSHPWRRRRVLGSLAAVALGFAALPVASADAQTVWRHGTLAAKSDAGYLFMAARRGFAEKFGIKIEIVQFKSDPTLLKAVIAGELDSYEGNPSSPFAAAARGGDIKIMGCHWPGLTYGLYARADSGINTVKDMVGKRIGTSGPGALPDVFTRAAIKEAGLDPKAVTMVNAGGDTDRIGALVAKTIDVAPSSSEFEPVLARQGLKMVAHAQQVTPQYVRFCMYTSGKVLAEKKDAAVRFLAAEMAALRHGLANPAEVIKLTREITKAPADDPKPEHIVAEVAKYNSIDPEFGIPVDKLSWLKGVLTETTGLPANFDFKPMIDTSVREQALRLAAGKK